MRRISHAFTLVEILIVVVILGILAAIVVPQMLYATEDAQQNAVRWELKKIYDAMGMYAAMHGDEKPPIVEGNGTWLGLLSPGYLKTAPVNGWVGGMNSTVIAFGDGPDAGFQSEHGWVYDPETGNVWAGSFDEAGNAYPR